MASLPIVLAVKLFEDLIPVVAASNKKADVAEHPQVFDHVGLLRNEPPGTAGLLFV
jgi:hypothetical protein